MMMPLHIITKEVLLVDIKRYDEAIRCFDKAIKIDGSTTTYNMKGVALEELGRDDEAMACYDMAIKSDEGLYGCTQ